jgi:predicted DNA-binding transcriptional regulator YafY
MRMDQLDKNIATQGTQGTEPRLHRLIAILIQLQTKRVVTAKELAEQFGTSLRTIYRDIRALEAAEVPIRAEAGVGYSLAKGFQMHPIAFTQQEATALLFGQKLTTKVLDQNTRTHYQSALNKIRSQLGLPQKDVIESLENAVEIHPWHHHPTQQEEKWLSVVQPAMLNNQVLRIGYFSFYQQKESQRNIEPIGLYFYAQHWHVIAWCQNRSNYRDFRLDRMHSIEVLPQYYQRNSHLTLQQYISQNQQKMNLTQIRVFFDEFALPYIHEFKYSMGWTSEHITPTGMEMEFVTPDTEYFTRMLLTYGGNAKILSPPEVIHKMRSLTQELFNLYN